MNRSAKKKAGNKPGFLVEKRSFLLIHDQNELR